MGLKDWWFRLKGSSIVDVIKRKHRFVVMDTDTFKEKFSFQLSGINLFVAVGITIIVLILLTTILIAFTPLREWIPGYTNNAAVEQTYANAKKLDSLQVQLENQEWMVATMQAVLRGEELGETQQMDSSATLQQVATVYRRSKEDSLLRLEVEREDNLYQVKSNNSGSAAATVVDASPAITHLFFTPLKGNILTPYSREHYGVDIAGEAGHAVCAAYSGTVLFSGFTAEANADHPASWECRHRLPQLQYAVGAARRRGSRRCTGGLCGQQRPSRIGAISAFRDMGERRRRQPGGIHIFLAT